WLRGGTCVTALRSPSGPQQDLLRRHVRSGQQRGGDSGGRPDRTARLGGGGGDAQDDDGLVDLTGGGDEVVPRRGGLGDGGPGGLDVVRLHAVDPVDAGRAGFQERAQQRIVRAGHLPLRHAGLDEDGRLDLAARDE